MINVLTKSRELTEVELYLMTVSPAIQVLNTVEDNTSIDVDAWLTFEDKKENGEVTELFSILSKNKKAYCCQSKTFRNSFSEIADIMGEKPFSIIKFSGKTKANKDYINCMLDISKL